jgi:hypothetical protein
MQTSELLTEIQKRGASICANGDRLRVTGDNFLDDNLRDRIIELKPELLLLLQSGATSAPPVAPADVPPALLEYSDRTFDERLKVWRRGDLIEYTRGTAPAYRKLWERHKRGEAA